MRIAFVCSHLQAGGAERVISILAGTAAKRGHTVTLITLARREKDFFVVQSGIKRVGLNLLQNSESKFGALLTNLKRAMAIRRELRRCDAEIVVSFGTSINILSIIASLRLKVRLLISERVDPASHRLAFPWDRLRAMLYRFADILVVQTKGAADWFASELGRCARIAVIVNPVVRWEGSDEAAHKVPVPFVLGAGRLVRQKGFDILIRAFARAAEKFPELHLVIAGEGPEDERLRDLRAELGLQARVSFSGVIADLPALMNRACLFALSSRYEGLPNVVLEALERGLPVIATDCPGGVREILGSGKYGLIVPPEDPDALAHALTRLASEDDLRAAFSRRAAEAIAPYCVESVMSRWERLMSDDLAACDYRQCTESPQSNQSVGACGASGGVRVTTDAQ